MDVRQLRNFLAVSEFRNFTRAAASLHLSQPALSHSVAQLERDLGTRLFERRKRSVELTTAGEALLPAARRAVRALTDAQQAISEVEGLRGGRVELTAPPALRTFPTAQLVARFRAEHPKVKIIVAEAQDSIDAAQRVQDGRAEAAVIDLGQASGALDQHYVATFPIRLAGFPKDRMLTSPVRLSEIADLPFACSPRGTGIHEIMDSAGLADSIFIEARSVDSILDHVIASRLFALMIEPYARRAEKAGAHVFDVEPPLERRVGIVTRAGLTSAAVRELIRISVARE